jgi:hypothetical protein
VDATFSGLIQPNRKTTNASAMPSVPNMTERTIDQTWAT